MSLPRRLWRLARNTLRATPLDASRWIDEARARRDAARELEEFLGHSPHGAEPPRPPPPPPHPFARQYAVLGVPVGSDAATVERAWRRLVLRHHPDRYAGDPAAERAAADRLRPINQAHDDLIAWLRDQENGQRG